MESRHDLLNVHIGRVVAKVNEAFRLWTKLLRGQDRAAPIACKVDDLAGHRLNEIIAFREGLHRVFFH